MKRIVAAIALAGVFATLCNPVRAADAPRVKVGEVIIVGNEVTQDRVIREAVGLYPGQVLRPEDLRTAEKNLERLGIFEIDPARGIRPTVTVLDGDGEFRDVMVRVTETKTGTLTLGAMINAKGMLVFSVVLEERNFDPRRWPTSLDDLRSGRVFRGAGQKLRLELSQPFPLPLRRPAASPRDNLMRAGPGLN